MPFAAHYRMFGHYCAWANIRLYEAAARLSTKQHRADRGAFFKSVHGTLNHLQATDRIWMQRFTGEGDAPNRPGRPRAGTRSLDFSAAVGKTRRRIS
jgi:uncharacterized damage-inducible protein DinB